MCFHLLTGATGLLGSYLLKDASTQDVPLAVVVRASRTAGARQRVEDILARWERQSLSLLPRPVVLEGDMTKPGLGLRASQVNWIRENCCGVTHCAASLNFVAASRDDDPYRTNVGGMKNLLELCRETGISKFHHVSTIDACGRRDGTTLESERSGGRVPENDYERSKIKAEALVVGADFLETKTIIRPGVIIGDSHSGYTRTFTGFYVPLKILHWLINSAKDHAGVNADDVLRQLNLDGLRRKHFVPVNWVSAVMMRVIATPEYHGRTYHLTPTHPTRFVDMAEAIADVFQDAGKLQSHANIGNSFLRDTLLNQLKAYESFWRDDPDIDRRNTLEVTGDLPCPTVDKEVLRRIVRYALKSNFGWPIEPSKIPELDASKLIEHSCEAGTTNGAAVKGVALVITGPGGGQWELQVLNGNVVGVNEGLTPRSHAIVRLGSHTLKEIVDGSWSARDALRIGRLMVATNNGAATPDVCDVIESFVRRGAKGLSLKYGQDGPLVSA